MAMNFVDFSSFQAGINLANFRGINKIIKITQGTNYVNGYAAGMFDAIPGEDRGIYHYIVPNVSAQDQANFFLRYAWPYLDGSTRPILDYEPSQQCTQIATDFLGIVARETARRSPGPMQYFNEWVARNITFPAEAAHYPIWLASYVWGSPTGFNFNVRNIPKIKNWDIVGQQFTSSGKLPGWNGKLDLSVFDITPSDWRGNPPPITVRDGFDMATMQDLINALLSPQFYQRLKDAINDELQHHEVIDRGKDDKGNEIHWNRDHALTYATAVAESNEQALANVVIPALNSLAEVVHNIAAQSPQVDLSAVTSQLDAIKTQLSGAVIVVGNVTMTPPPSSAGSTPPAIQ